MRAYLRFSLAGPARGRASALPRTDEQPRLLLHPSLVLHPRPAKPAARGLDTSGSSAGAFSVGELSQRTEYVNEPALPHRSTVPPTD